MATSGGRGEGVDVEQLIGSGTELTSPQTVRPHGAKSLHARRPGHAKTTFVRMNEATSSQIASQRWGLLEPCEPRSPRVASLKAVFAHRPRLLRMPVASLPFPRRRTSVG